MTFNVAMPILGYNNLICQNIKISSIGKKSLFFRVTCILFVKHPTKHFQRVNAKGIIVFVID